MGNYTDPRKKYPTAVSEDMEKRLVGMARDGNDKAFEQLVTIYEKTVFNMAMYIMKDREDALDVSQEVFIKLWRSLESFRGESSLKTYLMMLTRNAAYDLLRKKKRMQSAPLYYENEDGKETSMDIVDESDEANPEQSYLKKEKIETVRKAISTLDPSYRDVIIMRDISSMSYAEIARVTGLAEGTVKSRLSRARMALKKILQEWNYF